MKHLGLVVLAIALLSSPVVAADIHVDAVFGDDFTGNGTAAAPFRTITMGVANALAFDTVRVNPGIYNLMLGETFPLPVPPDVAIIGSGPHLSIVDGTGASWPTQTGMFKLQGNSEIAGFTFRNGPTASHWDAAIACWTDGVVTIHDNVFAGPNQNRGFVMYSYSSAPASVATAYNNIAYNLLKGSYTVHDFTTISIFNNTSANVSGAHFDISLTNGTMTGVLANNIGYNCPKYGVWGGTLPNVQLQNNCFYLNALGATTGTFASITGTVAADPLFVSDINKDCHLLPISPCVNAGVAAAHLADCDGEQRAFGAAVDIGADEVNDPSFYIRSPIEQATISALVTVGAPGGTYFQVIGAVPAAIPTGYGMLYMDPKFMIILMVGAVPPSGVAATLVGVPVAPAFVGIPIIGQSMVNYKLTGAQTFTLL